MTPEEFRSLGHRVVDWIADYRESIGDRPVMSAAEPGDIRRSLPDAAPVEAESWDAILADFEGLVSTGITHWQHPRFFGYFPGNHNLASVLGDYLSTGLGVVGVSWQASPALTELEDVVTDWARRLFGLSDAWTGAIQDTASTSTLVALLTARERATSFSAEGPGLAASPQPLMVYASEQSHSSVAKACKLAGFGLDHLRLVPCDETYGFRTDALEALMTEDRAEGRIPCAVVATTGTTSSTAFDPIGPAAAAAARHGAWLHVDAAMAGGGMILPELRHLWEGIEAADSVVINAHKWLGAAFDCALYYVKDPGALLRVMSTSPSYLQTAADDEVRNLRDWGLPLGRRFRALKLWFLLRAEGTGALQQRLRRDLSNARWLAREAGSSPEWRVAAPVVLQTVCLRHEPPGLDGEALDHHTRDWVERVNRSGGAYLTPARLGGRWVARVSIGAEATTSEDVAAVWALMRREAERT